MKESDTICCVHKLTIKYCVQYNIIPYSVISHGRCLKSYKRYILFMLQDDGEGGLVGPAWGTSQGSQGP